MFDTTCPFCNYKATDHESLEGGQIPKDGDISFCVECGEVSTYENRILIKLNIDDLEESTKKELKDLEIAWLMTRQQKKFAKNEVNGHG